MSDYPDLFSQPQETAVTDQKPEMPGYVSIKDAREYVKTGRIEGVYCPCCGQLAKVYRRQVHSTIARMLIRAYLLYKNSVTPGRYFHLSYVIDGISSTGINDFSKLVYWDLIEEKEKDPTQTERRTSGYWRITEKGINFVLGNTLIDKYALIYDNMVLGFEGQKVNMKDCLGKRFNYEELMNIQQ
jgi:hypothetical protein